MRNQDWSLVIFTSLAQLSIGISLFLTVLCFFSSEMSLPFEAGLNFRNPVLLALIFIGIATIISFLHLGSPANAVNALNNLSGSWLSREILAINIYALSLLLVLLAGFRMGNVDSLKYFLLLSSIVGMILLWMMIRIYVMPTIPAWNSWYTPVSFVSSVICLGLLALLILHNVGFVQMAVPLIRTFEFLLTLILLVEIASSLYHHSQLKKLDTGLDGPVFDHGPFHQLFLLRMGVLVLVISAMIVMVSQAGSGFDNSQTNWMSPWFTMPLFFLIAVQEFAGRHLFYSSYFRLGL